MALALVLFVSMFCATPPVPVATALLSSAQQSSDAKPSDSTAPQDQAAPPSTDKPAQPSAPAQPQTPSGQNPPAKHPPRKRKPVHSDCGTLPATGASQPSPAASSPASPPPAAATAANAATSGSANATTDCPPPKKVVRQGGVPDPHIQLAGGPGGKQASQEQAEANRRVAATEENLKDLAGRELSSSQKDVVSQIQQFVEQSKAAATAGDLDRALTLAKKAQLLSEELAKPPEK
jgi:hypothetical protein